MLENILISIIIHSTECKLNEVRVVTPYGDMCLTREQVKRLRG